MGIHRRHFCHALIAMPLLLCEMSAAEDDPRKMLRETLTRSRRTAGQYRVENEFNYRVTTICLRPSGSAIERMVADPEAKRRFLTLATARWILDDAAKIAMHLNYPDPFDHAFQDSLTLLALEGVTVEHVNAPFETTDADAFISLGLSAGTIDRLKEKKSGDLRKSGLSASDITAWFSKELAVKRVFAINSAERLLVAVRTYNQKNESLLFERYSGYAPLPEDPSPVFEIPKDYTKNVFVSAEAYRVFEQQRLLEKKRTFFKELEHSLTNSRPQTTN